MEPHCYHSFYLISFFLLINSSHSVCVPRNSSLFLAPHTSPELQPVSSPGLEPVPSPTPKLASPTTPVSSPSPIQNPPSTLVPPNSVSNPSSEPLFLPSTTNNPGLKKICDSTDYPILCLSTLAPLLKDKTDTASVLDIAIKASTEVTRLALIMAKKVATMPGTPPDIVSILNDCKDSYDSALENFQNAMDALPALDIGTMNSMLSAVLTDVGDCEDEFSGQSSPLANYADKVTKMTSNCLAIVSLIH